MTSISAQISPQQAATSRRERVVRQRDEIRAIDLRRPCERAPEVLRPIRRRAVRDDHQPGASILARPMGEAAQGMQDVLRALDEKRRQANARP